MKVFVCNSCGAEVKNNKPTNCPLCKRNSFKSYEKTEFDEELQSGSQIYQIRINSDDKKDSKKIKEDF